MRRRIAAMAVVVVSLVAGLCTAAGAQAPSSHKIQVLITQAGNTSVAVVHGAFTGGGRDVTKGNKDILHLGGGTLTVKHKESDAKESFKLNPKTCFLHFKITGPYTITAATGRFKGVGGNGTYVVHGQSVLKHKANGKCNQRARPKAEVTYIMAHGPVTLPSS